MLFWDDGNVQWAVREDDWKLLKNRKGQIELYNLKNDLGEKKDLSKKHPDILERLYKAYKEWKTKMGRSIRTKELKTWSNRSDYHPDPSTSH